MSFRAESVSSTGGAALFADERLVCLGSVSGFEALLCFIPVLDAGNSCGIITVNLAGMGNSGIAPVASKWQKEVGEKLDRKKIGW